MGLTQLDAGAVSGRCECAAGHGHGGRGRLEDERRYLAVGRWDLAGDVCLLGGTRPRETTGISGCATVFRRFKGAASQSAREMGIERLRQRLEPRAPCCG